MKRKSKSTPKRHTVAPPDIKKSKVASAINSVTPLQPEPGDSDKKVGANNRPPNVNQPSFVVSPTLILQIRERCARRSVTIKNCVSFTNRTKAVVRRFLGWQTDLSKADQESIKELASQIVTAVEKEQVAKLPKEYHDIALAITPIIVHNRLSMVHQEDLRAKEEKELVKLAAQLPAADFILSIKGVGLLKLAEIVGEAGGDLANFSVCGLRKRMGLAPFNGRAPSTWKKPEFSKGVSKENWVEMGYVGRRRALMHVIFECIIKNQSEGSAYDYKKVYYDRKAYEIKRDPDIKPIIAHRRAQRVTMQRLLKHIWQAWRGQKPNDEWVKQ